MRGNSKTFPYRAANGFEYQVLINLEHHPETGQYTGLAQAYEGPPNNSAYVGNAMPLEAFNAESDDDAYAQGLTWLGAQLDAGAVATPGVLGRLAPLSSAPGLDPAAEAAAAARGADDPASGTAPSPTGGRSDTARPATQVAAGADTSPSSPPA